MIVKMARMRILGLRDLAIDAIDVIHEQGTLHVEDLTDKIASHDSKRVVRMEVEPHHAENEYALNTLRSRINDLLRDLSIETATLSSPAIEREYQAIWSDNVAVMIARIEDDLQKIESATRETVEKRADLLAESSRLKKYAPIMSKVQPLAERVFRMRNMASIALVIDRRAKSILQPLKSEINKITEGQSELISADVNDDTTAVLVVFEKQYLRKVHDFLAVQEISQIQLPGDLASKPLETAVAEVQQRLSSIPSEMREVETRLKYIADKYGVSLVAMRNTICDRMHALEAVPKFGQTDETFIISGWLPVDAVKPMQKALNERFGGEVVTAVTEVRPVHTEEEDDGSEDVPVCLRNRPYVSFFEILYLLQAYPKYGTIDPTALFSIFFPIFFGFMVGDMGYGLALAGLGFWIYRRFSDKALARKAGFILTVSGLVAVFFGILYVELFGDWILRIAGRFYEDGLGEEHLNYFIGNDNTIIRWPMDRIHGFSLFFGITLIIGFMHLTIGLVFGMINARREGNMKLFNEKAGFLLVITGLMMAIARFGLADWPMALVFIGVALAVFGAGLATFGGGMGGLIESVVGVSNIFSYARLIAIGLASAVMATVANSLSRDAAGNGAIGVIGAVLIFAVFHGLNLILAFFSPSIHSLRLHLVECFGKFYETTSLRYEPFRKTGGVE